MLFPGFYHKQTLTNAAVQKKRVELFNKEAKRQAAFITDVEKITVKYSDQPEECTLVMNKNMSTPYNCAQRKFGMQATVSFILNKIICPKKDREIKRFLQIFKIIYLNCRCKAQLHNLIQHMYIFV